HPEITRFAVTGWWRGADSNSRDPSGLEGRNSTRVWRAIQPRIKASVLERICSPWIRLFFEARRFHSFATLARGNLVTIKHQTKISSSKLPLLLDCSGEM